MAGGAIANTAPGTFVQGTAQDSNTDLYELTASDLIACSTGCTFSVTNDQITTTCKDNDGRASFILGQQTYELSVEGLVNYTNKGRAEMYAAAASKSTVTVVYGTGVDDDPFFMANAVISSFEESAPLNDVATWSVTFAIKGETVVEGAFDSSTDDDPFSNA